VIVGFGDAATEDLFHGIASARARRFPPDIVRPARRKLMVLHATVRLEDLRVPPSNRLEPLKGNRVGAHSIRINEKWRIVFRWQDGNAFEAQVVDYH
jgi:proteic killer suppression protein